MKNNIPMNKYLHDFLKRTNLMDLYESLGDKDDPLMELRLYVEDNDTYRAISDAFHSSPEYKAMIEGLDKRDNELWNEAITSIERGSADYDCIVEYAAGTNGLYRTDNYHDTRTVCYINIDGSGIECSVKEGYIEIRAEGNAELNCLIDAFLDIAGILSRQSNKNEK